MTATRKEADNQKPWGGRFTEKTAASVEAFTASIHFDARLYKHDIAGSRAHARMLARQGLITDDDCQQILAGLAEIEQEIEQGRFAWRLELEDIHMHIEKALVGKIGKAGEKLHTARSRNDQVALDMRLYLREETRRLQQLLLELRRAFVRSARLHLGMKMPGYTHLQRAQPVLVSHHLLAYYEMFGRDAGRLSDCLTRMDVMPLGAAALAGTGLPIDREFVAAELGFPAVTRNSMDTVADRDFLVEFVGCCALIQVHLSRLAEELVLWASQEFAFISIPDRFCTGSSIMPQKKNPDIPELIRGKSGRVIGDLISLLTMLKGLPLTYNRDLQEDKEPVFDAVDTVGASLALAAELLGSITFNRDVVERAAGSGFLTATDLADYLVKKQVPFRQAHGIVGGVVAACLEQGVELHELPLDELRKFSTSIEQDVYDCLSAEGSVASRVSTGGTAMGQVESALVLAEKELGLAG